MMKTKSALDMIDMSKLTHMRLAQHIGIKSTDFALAHPEVQELIYAKDKKGNSICSLWNSSTMREL